MGGATNLKWGGGSMHWNLGGKYSQNTIISKRWRVHDPPPTPMVAQPRAGTIS